MGRRQIAVERRQWDIGMSVRGIPTRAPTLDQTLATHPKNTHAAASLIHTHNTHTHTHAHIHTQVPGYVVFRVLTFCVKFTVALIRDALSPTTWAAGGRGRGKVGQTNPATRKYKLDQVKGD